MSAPNAGRQSPSPSRQSGAQQQDVPASGRPGTHSDDKSNDEDTGTKEKSEETKGGLQSNPTHPLAAVEDEKLK